MEHGNGQATAGIPAQAQLRRHPGAGRQGPPRCARAGVAVLHPEARRQPPALRLSPGAERHPQELGHPQGPVTGPEGQAPGRPRRRPPAGLRQLRGQHPRRPLRCGRSDRVGPRRVAARGRPGPGLCQRQAAFSPAGRKAERHLASVSHPPWRQEGTVDAGQVRRRGCPRRGRLRRAAGPARQRAQRAQPDPPHQGQGQRQGQGQAQGRPPRFAAQPGPAH